VYGVEIAAGTAFLSIPLVLSFGILAAALFSTDILHPLKPSSPASKPLGEGFLWMCRSYGGILGAGIAAIVITWTVH
jgi:hypothetical protein